MPRKYTGYIQSFKENRHTLIFRVNGSRISFGTYPTREIADEARVYALSIGCNIDEFKKSKYWTELTNDSINSHRHTSVGSIYKRKNTGKWRVEFYMNGKKLRLGDYFDKNIAEEAKKCFIDLDYNFEEFKKTKFWTDLRQIGYASEDYKSKGSVIKTKASHWQVHFSIKGKQTSLGTFARKEIA